MWQVERVTLLTHAILSALVNSQTRYKALYKCHVYFTLLYFTLLYEQYTLCFTFAGVTNAEFICGKAEDVLPNLMWRLSGQEVIVVVDPPRAGLRAFHSVLAQTLNI